MADEVVGVEETTQDVVEETEEVVTEEQDETNSPAEPDSSTDDTEIRQLWSDTIPELGGEFDKLDLTAQRNILLKRLKAVAGQAATATADTEASDTAKGRQKSGTPSVPEMSALSKDAILSVAQKAIDEGDANGLADTIFGLQTWLKDAVGAMMDVFNDQDGRIEALTLPSAFKEVQAAVPGATEADVQTAMGLYKGGKIADPKTALKVAVYDRQQEILAAKGKKGLSADEAARKKAAALRASQYGQGSAPTGKVRGPLPTNADEEREFLKSMLKKG